MTDLDPFEIVRVESYRFLLLLKSPLRRWTDVAIDPHDERERDHELRAVPPNIKAVRE